MCEWKLRETYVPANLKIMWSSTGGDQTVKEIVATASSVREGINRLLGYFQARCPHPIWNKMAQLDYDQDMWNIHAWLDAQLPLPDAVEVLWFAFWDVTRGFDLRGSSTWSKDAEDWEWTYSDDFRGESYASPVLNQTLTLAREADDPTIFGRPENGVWDLTDYLLTIGYVGLVPAHIFRTGDAKRLLGERRERWIVTGFPDAVYGIIVGRLTAQGFEPLANGRLR